MRQSGLTNPWSTVSMIVNGSKVVAQVAPRETLADFLRQSLELTGTHTGCEMGVCGACLVAARRTRRAFLPDVRGAGERFGDRDHGRPDRERRDRRYPGGIPSAQRAAMRLLYARHADDGARVCCRSPASLAATRSAMRCRAIIAAAPDMKRSSMRSRRWPAARNAASSGADATRKPAHERTYLARPSEFLYRPLGAASRTPSGCWPAAAAMSPTSFCRACFMPPIVRSPYAHARIVSIDAQAARDDARRAAGCDRRGSRTLLHALGRHAWTISRA